MKVKVFIAVALGHVLDDQDGRLVLVCGDDADHAQRSIAPDRDRVADVSPTRQLVTVLFMADV